MSSVPQPRYSFAEYLLLEEGSTVRHEFVDGLILAMAGGTPEHAALAAAVITRLSAGLVDRPCRVFSSDLRLRVLETGLATYPDAAVVCGRLETDPDSALTVTNPVVVVEVTSPSTERYDRAEKLDHYKRIRSLREVVLVAHDRVEVEVHRRDGERWTVHRYGPDQRAELASIGVTFPVAPLYVDPLA
jgi:Uma2 family endonuclease